MTGDMSTSRFDCYERGLSIVACWRLARDECPGDDAAATERYRELLDANGHRNPEAES